MRYLSLDLTRLRNSDTWAEAHKHPWMGLACHNLWYAAADRDGDGIPDDDDVLSRLAGVKPAVWKAIKARVLKAWNLENGKWTHPIIIAEAARCRVSVEAGKKGAAKRWKGAEKDVAPNSPPKGAPNGDPNGNPIREANSPPNTNSHVMSSQVSSSSTETSGSKSAKVQPLDRLAKAIGIELQALLRLPKFQEFPGMFAEWKTAGCDPDRDVWPTIERIAKRSKNVKSPRFFEAAILEARDNRLASEPSEAERWAGRLETFKSHGFWSEHWGPKPGDPGCKAPPDLI